MKAIGPDELPDDLLLHFAAQRFGPRVRAWRHGGGFAVATLDIARRDRLAVHGPVEHLVPLVSHALDEQPTLRAIGDAPLVTAIAAALPVLRLTREFRWMTTRTAPPTQPPAVETGDDGVVDLLTRVMPHSDAWPGRPGVLRWWRVTQSGRTVASACEAWSAPGVGYLAGVAVDPDCRGQGLARALCAHALREMVEEHGAAALMVDDDNTAARALYTSLGLDDRALRVAALD